VYGLAGYAPHAVAGEVVMDRRELFKGLLGAGVGCGFISSSASTEAAIPPSVTVNTHPGASFFLNGREIAHALHTIKALARNKSGRWFRLEGYWSAHMQSYLDALPSTPVSFRYAPEGQTPGKQFLSGMVTLERVKHTARKNDIHQLRIDLKIESTYRARY
jgi:hypothetical protein